MESDPKPRGRPRREDRGKVGKAFCCKLYGEDFERLARLAETYGDKSRAIRLALELLESMPVQGERLASEE